MAKKPTSAPKFSAPAPKIPSKAPISSPAKSIAPVSTPVRNTAVPKPQTATKPAITHELIAKRAYEISQSPACGSEYDNWVRAERELRGA